MYREECRWYKEECAKYKDVRRVYREQRGMYKGVRRMFKEECRVYKEERGMFKDVRRMFKEECGKYGDVRHEHPCTCGIHLGKYGIHLRKNGPEGWMGGVHLGQTCRYRGRCRRSSKSPIAGIAPVRRYRLLGAMCLKAIGAQLPLMRGTRPRRSESSRFSR